MNDKTKLATILAGVYSFYRADLTDFQLAAWLRVLAGFRVEQVQDALDAHLVDPGTGQFLPKPADIVKHLHGTRPDRAALAWSKVFAAIGIVGAYRSLAFDDPAIHCAVEDLGGWPALCQSKIGDLPFVEQRFAKSYVAHEKAKTAPVPVLIGIVEATNRLRGFKAEPPMLVGDRDKAAALATGDMPERAALTDFAQSIANAIPRKLLP